jgi:hypothetical protein
MEQHGFHQPDNILGWAPAYWFENSGPRNKNDARPAKTGFEGQTAVKDSQENQAGHSGDEHMPNESHQRAAEFHEQAAHAHRAAAVHHGKEDHQTGHEHSRQALEHSAKAYEFAQEAYRKSERAAGQKK